jgi:hypothetical protein
LLSSFGPDGPWWCSSTVATNYSKIAANRKTTTHFIVLLPVPDQLHGLLKWTIADGPYVHVSSCRVWFKGTIVLTAFTGERVVAFEKGQG